VTDGLAIPEYRLLSVVVPVFNERNTVAEILRRMRAVELPVDREIIVVDDGSSDGTEKVLPTLEDSTVRVIRHAGNRGKGAAIRPASCTAAALPASTRICCSSTGSATSSYRW
jgi:GT2 family glycosyltransferase